MLNYRHATVMACLALSTLAVVAADDAPNPKAKAFPHLHGIWTVSQGLNAALGFPDEASRPEVDRVSVSPISFKLSLTETIGEGMAANLLIHYRDTVFKRISHRIVATGKWEQTFQNKVEGRLLSSDCFVTEHEGATYLWTPAPYVGLMGGRMSYLEGASEKHDAIVIDFDIRSGRDGEARSIDTIAYQRKSN